MRNFLILSVIALGAIISCHQTSDTIRPTVIKTDSSWALCLYKDFYDGKAKPGIIRRVVKDSFMYVYADTLMNNERRWIKDTFYIEPVQVPVDSISSKRVKMPIKDSTGKQNYINYFVPITKRFVVSGWDHVDSILVKKLEQQQ